MSLGTTRLFEKKIILVYKKIKCTFSPLDVGRDGNRLGRSTRATA